MSVDLSYSEWCLGRLAQRVREGWLYVDISPNNRCLIRPDRDCDISSCPRRGTAHRHQPTLADREKAYDIVTDWLALEFQHEGVQKDIRELNRIYALENPRLSQTFDADAVSVVECRRIWRKCTESSTRSNTARQPPRGASGFEVDRNTFLC